MGTTAQAVSPQGALLDRGPWNASGGTETHTLDSRARLDDRGQCNHWQACRQEEFVRDTGHKAKVKISYLGDNFTLWFLNGDGKTEDPESVQTLRYHKLRQLSVDGPIIAELGGAEKSETTLSEMFSLMEKQGKGEDGVLLNNGYANIFYIKDNVGVLRSVVARWLDGGWYVFARSVDNRREWSADYQVFSRNSSEPSAPASTATTPTT